MEQLSLPDYIDLKAMHAEIRSKVFSLLPKSKGHIALFQGGRNAFQYDTDHEHLFRQESYFYYLFGVNEPNLYGMLDLGNQRSYLFLPRLGLEYEIWCGKTRTPEEYSDKYGIEEVKYVDELPIELKRLNVTTIHMLQGVNSDSGTAFETPHFEGISQYDVDGSLLWNIMCESRLIKSSGEQALMRHINAISSKAHVYVMQRCCPGMYEYQLESIFIHFTSFYGGSRYQAYTCICGTGPNGAALHYGHAAAPNSRQLSDGDMCLLDMGAELHCYASDITCSFPANGKFTQRQRIVYEIVLQAQKAVEAAIRPGVEWSDMHLLALRVIGEGLLRERFVFGKDVDEIMALHIPALFFPHGLGHLIGLDTHDVGGFPKGRSRLEGPSLSKLRMNRVLQAGMVVSNEPGLYFIEALLQRAISDPVLSKHINVPKIQDYMGFGGVRLEDNLIITENGCENMTRVPRIVEEIERVMAGADFA